ncbi:MAG TPA: hypothetical protein VNO23_04740, partial [Candidatus Binatia bacterium]|nr:hypothetical protein [Candidatus Binatia bacterium]
MARRSTVVLIGVVLLFNASAPAAGPESRETAVVRTPFPRVAEASEKAIAEERMTLVCHADAQRGAAARGVMIRGNQVFMVFRNDFAVRLLAAERPRPSVVGASRSPATAAGNQGRGVDGDRHAEHDGRRRHGTVDREDREPGQ